MADSSRSSQRLSAAERRARVVAMRRRRATFDDIGRALGITRQRAYQLYRDALRAIPVRDVSEHVDEELILIDDACAGLIAIAANRRVGARTRVEAWNVLCKWSERKSRLLGMDAPARTRVEIVDDEVARVLVDQLEAQLASLTDGTAPGAG